MVVQGPCLGGGGLICQPSVRESYSSEPRCSHLWNGNPYLSSRAGLKKNQEMDRQCFIKGQLLQKT